MDTETRQSFLVLLKVRRFLYSVRADKPFRDILAEMMVLIANSYNGGVFAFPKVDFLMKKESLVSLNKF